MMIGARLAMGARRRPYAYEVEYLESSGTQFIDTVVQADHDVGCEVDAEFVSISAENLPTVIGWEDGNANAGACVFLYEEDNNVSLNVASYYMGYDEVTIVYSAGVRFSAKLNILGSTRIEIKTDSELTYRDDVVFGNGGFVVPVSLFALKGADGVAYYHSYARIYSAKVSISSAVVRDFIPVCGHDGKGYMFDRVSGKLFGNSGTGEFILGPRVASNAARSTVTEGGDFVN